MALLIACSSRAQEFAGLARKLDPGLDVRVAPETGRREDVRYALAWQAPQDAYTKALLAAAFDLSVVHRAAVAT